MSQVTRLVLLLDDDLAVLRSLERLLSAHGYQVRAYSRPEDFLCAGFPPLPACLVLDQNLGEVKGTEVHAEMRLRGWDLPTLFLTADSDTRTVVRAMRSGADDYITKPFDPDELVAAVGRAVRRSGASQQASGEVAECHARAALLTKRERLVVGMVVAGLLNKEIADRLKVAMVTVKVHRGRAMHKLGAKNAAELARIVALAGIPPSFGR